MTMLMMMQINNAGSAAVVVVSCVTKDPPYYPHPHSLVGQSCQDGVCTLRVKNTNIVRYSMLYIYTVSPKMFPPLHSL